MSQTTTPTSAQDRLTKTIMKQIHAIGVTIEPIENALQSFNKNTNEVKNATVKLKNLITMVMVTVKDEPVAKGVQDSYKTISTEMTATAFANNLELFSQQIKKNDLGDAFQEALTLWVSQSKLTDNFIHALDDFQKQNAEIPQSIGDKIQGLKSTFQKLVKAESELRFKGTTYPAQTATFG